jgi:hypothetical protein
MPNTEKKSDLNDVPKDILMNYYNHQYERMGKLEDSRMAITNITITLSVLAFTFGFNASVQYSQLIGYALLFIMMTANWFAIAYILVTKSWIETYKRRSKGILEISAKPLFLFDEKTHANYSKRTPTLWQIHMSLHVLLILVAIAMAIFLSSMPVA